MDRLLLKVYDSLVTRRIGQQLEKPASHAAGACSVNAPEPESQALSSRSVSSVPNKTLVPTKKGHIFCASDYAVNVEITKCDLSRTEILSL